jgi:cell division protein FtsW
MKNFLSQGVGGFSRIWTRSRTGIGGGIKEGLNDFRSELKDATKAKKYSRSGMTQWDQPLLWCTTLLVLIGIVMVYSSSISLANGSGSSGNQTSISYLIRHVISICIAFCAGLIAYQIPLKVWDRITPLVFAITIILLIVVLIPGIGHAVKGSRRWIPLGLMNFQPSELMKFACVLFVAHYTVRRQEFLHSFVKGFLPMGFIVGMVGVLLLLEPDMGAFLVVAGVAMGILFLGGISAKLFSYLIFISIVAFSTIVALSPFRAKRIMAFLDPWDPEQAQGKAYQLTHSLMAFGRGEWFGVGLGGSVEKLHYLPEAHTDFILAVIGEELGFIGVLIVILAFYYIVRRAFMIGRTCLQLDRSYAGLVAKGIGIWIGWQTFINMGVNLGLLPTKGLTLPLVSYGGSALLLNFIAIAVLLKIDAENRVLMRGGKL